MVIYFGTNDSVNVAHLLIASEGFFQWTQWIRWSAISFGDETTALHETLKCLSAKKKMDFFQVNNLVRIFHFWDISCILRCDLLFLDKCTNNYTVYTIHGWCRDQGARKNCWYDLATLERFRGNGRLLGGNPRVFFSLNSTDTPHIWSLKMGDSVASLAKNYSLRISW